MKKLIKGIILITVKGSALMNRSSNRYNPSSILVLMLVLSMSQLGCNQSKSDENQANRILIEAKIPADIFEVKGKVLFLKRNAELRFLPINQVGFVPEWKSITAKVTSDKILWVLYSKDPVIMNSDFGILRMVSPGDSIHIEYNGH